MKSTHSKSRLCPECGGAALYSSDALSAGLYGPALLPGLGSFLTPADFEVIVCADCGLTRFYADPAARLNVRSRRGWRALKETNS